MNRVDTMKHIAEVYADTFNIGMGLWRKELPSLVKRDRELILR